MYVNLENMIFVGNKDIQQSDGRSSFSSLVETPKKTNQSYGHLYNCGIQYSDERSYSSFFMGRPK
jgi:hypothetical protein